MNLTKEGKILFAYAVQRLTAANIPVDKWSFGGGTSLMLRYDHRDSKDIDIFFRDPQLLTYVSPRINDAVEDKIRDYSEHTQFTRIVFAEGEIDFIVSPQLTRCVPVSEIVDGHSVLLDSPVEVVAKKVHFRAADFKPRDIFDLALVYTDMKAEILENAEIFIPHLKTLTDRFEALNDSGLLEQLLSDLAVAPGGLKFRGRETGIFKGFLKDMGQISGVVQN